MSSYSSHTDEQLLLLLQDGDEAAFTEIYERYWAVLFLHVRNMLREDEEAKDIVQELFTAFWQKSGGVQLTGLLSSYLYQAARNRVFDHLRHKKVVNDYLKSLQEFMNEGTVEADGLLREKELARIIEEVISTLPPKMREVFELSRRRHLSYREIAAELDISESTVKSQVSNALHILRTKVGPSSVILLACLLHHKP